LTAGHSLGEYGALALSGALSFEDAVKAVVKRAALMEEACRKNPSTMAAVIGLDESKVTEICEIASASGVVVPANFNSSNQIVISGTVDGVDEASRLCRQQGAKKVVILEVGGAFHSPLMESAREGMKEYLASVELREPRIAVIPNVTGTAESDPVRLKELLVKQLTAPVRWCQTMQYFNEHDIDTMIEVGPGKVLAALARRELKGAQVYNIDTLEDIEKFSDALVG
jgi:[acyl-carrier-protein] S-malonyltransferase